MIVTAKGGDVSPIKDWPHAPIHRFNSNAIYMVTGATLHKQHLFPTNDKLSLLEGELLTLAKKYEWQLEAWAVFVNHYHFVGRGSEENNSLENFLKHLHSNSAREVNKLDGAAGRQVWFNFWETELTYERSYLARLNYVHQNAVKHGLVSVANQYPWCSASWFERTASPAAIKTIYGFKIDRLAIDDDF
jgi:putative transposase